MATVTPTFERESQAGSVIGLSAVSWPAIFAGAAAAAALSLILLVLGTGLGLAAVSPWSTRGASAHAMTWSSILWIVFVAIASSGLGGYIAGRLRIRWPSLHTDEVYFRDTAHGFLAWTVATLVTAVALASAIASILGTGATVASGAVVAGGAVAAQQLSGSQSEERRDPISMYVIDGLFRAPADSASVGAGTQAQVQGAASRQSAPASDISLAATKGEAARIFTNGLEGASLSPEDSRYTAALIAQRTGISQADAEQRVNSAFSAAQSARQQAEAKAKEVADQARKDGAYASLWVFVSLLSGAFFASLMATLGGRQRDRF